MLGMIAGSGNCGLSEARYQPHPWRRQRRYPQNSAGATTTTISILPATLPTYAHPTVIPNGQANTLVLAPIMTLDL